MKWLIVVGVVLVFVAIGLLKRDDEETTAAKRNTFRFVLVSDLDVNSRVAGEANAWRALVQYGRLARTQTGRYRIEFDGPATAVQSRLAFGGRGMELSEAVVFDGRLLVMCDASGVVYELNTTDHSVAVLSQHMFDGVDKAFKIEWATVKDGELLLGSIGKEWVHQRRVTGQQPNTVLRWAAGGGTSSDDWTERFARLRRAANASFPGYLLHEAIEWEPVHRRWVVLPRRASRTMYDPKEDERMGTNLLLLASEDFADVTVRTLGAVEPEWGVTSVARIPGTDGRHFLVVRAQEADDRVATKLTVASIDGEFLLDGADHYAWPPDAHTVKYEGAAVFW